MDERDNLSNYLLQYRLQNDDAAADALKKNGSPRDYQYPYAGLNSDQKTYMAKNFSWFERYLGLGRSKTQNEEIYIQAKSDAGLLYTWNDVLTPNGIQTSNFYNFVDPIRNSPLLATGVYLGATAAGASKENSEKLVFIASQLSDIGASFILPRMGVSPVLGDTVVKPIGDGQNGVVGGVGLEVKSDGKGAYKPVSGETTGSNLSGYGNQNSGYGKTSLIDANGNPVAIGVPATNKVEANSAERTLGGKSIVDLAQAATAVDKGDLSVAGRALQKHGNCDGSAFLSAQGNPAAVNEQAQQVVNKILNDPATIATQRNTGRFGQVTDIVAPDGRWLRDDANGKLIGFLEHPKK